MNALEQSESANRRSPASGGSATVESANQWAEVGRDCLKKAMEAIAQSHFGTADQYRKASDEAFAKELKLRESPNAEVRHSAGKTERDQK